MNHLYYGDNLTIMQRMPKWSVDLIYLDPPFNSKQNYNLIYKNLTGKPVPDQAEAFCDTWEMDPQKEEIARAMPILMREHGVADYYVEFWRLWINALRHTQPHLLAYLVYMVQRLLHMKSILRPTGSIYLHCDSTASHYIKVMMDGIFKHDNFRNEIIWKRYDRPKGSQHKSKRYGRSSDTILFYSASDTYTFNADKIRVKLTPEEIEARYPYVDKKGRYMNGPLLRSDSMGERPNLVFEFAGYTPGKAGWRMEKEKLQKLFDDGDFLFTSSGTPRRKFRPTNDPGQIVDNVWTDIPALAAQDNERLGYPTQKPKSLLKRIIEASSNKGDVVFDPFCGCGTTIYAAQELERQWIGCDIAILSIKIMREILTGDKYRLVEGSHFKVDGIPVSVEQAEDLFNRDPFQFEHWIVERVGGFPTKKTGDKGIDGRLYFETMKGLKCMVLSVKGGKLRPSDVRDLRGTMVDLPDVEIAGFLSLQEPSKAMYDAASLAGQYEYSGTKYDRIQFLTVREILEEKRDFHTPTKMASRISSPQGSFAF
ncbi:MAG TPA: site-specific DNA-methyltransferase [Roseiarcus sp.]|nr:site-specific DNA-methyltransferase [Roseiarcus sp.]